MENTDNKNEKEQNKINIEDEKKKEEEKNEKESNNSIKTNEENGKEKEEEKNNQSTEDKKEEGKNNKNVEDKKEEGKETIDPHLIFQKELLDIIKKQEKILNATSTINEKFDVSNSITKEQIASFKTNIDKYGKYLLMIKKELGMISDTMRKINKLSKEQKK